MGKSKKKARSGPSTAGPSAEAFEDEWAEADFLKANDSSVWKKVDVDESLLYGPVGGFMGLEELDADYDLEQEDGVTRVKVHAKRPSKPASGVGKKTKASQGTAKSSFTVEEMEDNDGIESNKRQAPPSAGSEGAQAKKKRKTKGKNDVAGATGGDAETGIVKGATGSSTQNGKGGSSKPSKAEQRGMGRAKADSALPSDAAGGDKDEDGAVAETDMSSWDTFDMHPLILKGLAALRYTAPTAIQQAVWPAAVHHNADVMGAAETGSGKTLAFGLPMLHKLQYMAEDESNSELFGNETRPLLSLILCPTRELAMQVKDHLVSAARFTGLRVAAIVGGMSVEKQVRILRSRPHIVVATPGRFYELYKKRAPHLSDLTQLRFLVLDEADRMIEKNHFEDLTSILSLLPPPMPAKQGPKGGKPEASEEASDSDAGGSEDEALALGDGDSAEELGEDGDESSGGNEAEPVDFATAWEQATDVNVKHERQTMVFSATLTLATSKVVWRKGAAKSIPESTLDALRSKLQFRPNVQVCDLSAGLGLASALTEGCITCLADEKDFYLYYFLLRYPGRTLVFTNSIDCIRHITPLLEVLGMQPLGLHANMQQRQRLKNLDRFRTRDNAVLVATDVAARGLDIKGVQHVIHYQLPRTVELYVHRSGRTARAQEGGVSVMLLGPEDLKVYKTICRALKKDEGFNDFPVDMAYLPAIKKRVSLARRIEKHIHEKRKSKSDADWFRRAAKDMDIDVDEDLLKGEEKEKSAADRRKEAEVKKMQADLKALLAEPVLPRGVNLHYLTSSTVEDLAGRLLARGGEAVPRSKEEKDKPLAAAEALKGSKKTKIRTKRR